MPKGPKEQRTLLETEALIVGYAMSRLDRAYLDHGGYESWSEAFVAAARALGVPQASIKNLRDEFDPYHDNGRRGWHGRALRPSRHRIMEELGDLSTDAVMELANRILHHDRQATEEAVRSLANVDRVAHNVAERLLTGRRAEEYFLKNCERIINVPAAELEDSRLSACGYDFSVRTDPRRVVEVKGLKERRGTIQFTDREWSEAASRREYYHLVVVGGLSGRPAARVVDNPHGSLDCSSAYQQRVAVVWSARISV